jgi:hypothetical protein
MLTMLIVFVGGIVIDQYPRWAGVPNCDQSVPWGPGSKEEAAREPFVLAGSFFAPTLSKWESRGVGAPSNLVDAQG